jgi:hypothetical protein
MRLQVEQLSLLNPFAPRVPAWPSACYHVHVAKPDTPNFSLPVRIAFGVVALVMIVCMLRYFAIV